MDQQRKDSDAEKLDKIRDYKEKGNVAHKEGKYKKAVGSYHRALLYIKGLSINCTDINTLMGGQPQSAQKMTPEMLEESKKLTCDCYNNLAACLLKDPEPNYERIIEYCDKALSISASNGKALFRKGVSLYSLGKFSEALNVLKEAPPGPEVRKYMELCKEGQKQQEADLTDLYKGMFKF